MDLSDWDYELPDDRDQYGRVVYGCFSRQAPLVPHALQTLGSRFGTEPVAYQVQVFREGVRPLQPGEQERLEALFRACYPVLRERVAEVPGTAR